MNPTNFFLKSLICPMILFIIGLTNVYCQDSLRFKSPPEINKARLVTTIVAEGVASAGIASYLQFIWYKGHQRVPFHFDNDNKAYLQCDKFGHVWGAYMESYIGYKLLRGAGVKKNPALLYGGTLGLILQAPIEIFDGIYDGWGFSWGDMVANATGSCLLLGQELLFDKQVLTYKLSYHASPYQLSSSGHQITAPIKRLFDYNCQTYWLSIPLKKIVPVSKIPAWLGLSLGYSGTGMLGKYENITSYNGIPVPYADRYRKYLLSLDIDWTKIKTNSKFLRALLDCMFFIKLPFPALEFNSLGRVKGHLLYY